VDKVVHILWIVEKIKPRNILSVDCFIKCKKNTDVIKGDDNDELLDKLQFKKSLLPIN
jgi:hypothetical protein